MHRCCPRGGAYTVASSSSSSSSSQMRRAAALLLRLQRRRVAAEGRQLPPSGFLVVRSTSSSSSLSPSPPPSPPPHLTPLPAALARARACASTPELTFRVAGVSFEGRQQAASSVHKNQPLLLQRERSNAFDPRAVAVTMLDGKKQIGYVPRGETERVLPEDEDSAFAFVRSVGRAHLKGGEGEGEGEGEKEEEHEEDHDHDDQDRLGPWGVSVALKPGLPPLEIDALPSVISQAGPLSGALPEEEWRRLAKEAAMASGFCCAVTGGVGGGGGGENEDGPESRSAPVEAHEHWRFDDEAKVAELLGVRALCPEAHDVAHALSLESPESKARALLTLRTVNGWSTEDAALYWRGREELAASRSGEGSGEGSSNCQEEEQHKPKKTKTKKKEETSSLPSWGIDARWLVSRGIDLEQLSPAWRELLV